MTKGQNPVPSSTGNSFEEQALAQFNAGKYKEAIDLYKKLLRNGDNHEWQQQLAFCYLQRALAFADKGMFKEALVLWENYAGHARLPYDKHDHYISWLIQSKNPAKIESTLGRLTAQELDQKYPSLSAFLSLLILTDHPHYQQVLPQDSALIAHLKIVQTALQAYRDKHPASVEKALKQLPYRSAFRDFRTLLKAAIVVSTSETEAQSLLAKIPVNSPYSQTAGLLLTCMRKGAALAQEMIKFTPQQRRVVGEITGLNKKQLELLGTLSKHQERLSDKIKFNLAIQYQSSGDTELAKRFCLAMLADYPAGQRDFERHFGPIDEFELNRLKALAHERNHYSNDAEFYWRHCIRALVHAETDNALKIALILRRIAASQGGLEQAETLIESLSYDPDDKDSYLGILDCYHQDPETAGTYKNWLNKTIAQFPEDIDVLTLAIQDAIRNQAFKKVTPYASKILKIDPLNSFAKQALFSSHLAHARQCLKGKKYQWVEKEIQQAQDLKIGNQNLNQAQLIRGFFMFASGDKQQGLALITESLQTLHSDPINLHFQAAIEALLTGQAVATVLRNLPPVNEHVLSAQELTQLIQQITLHNQDNADPELLTKALNKIKAPLKQSLQQQDYPEHLLISLCRTLDTLKHFELLRHCSKLALAKWQKPFWIYYKIYSDTNGDASKCTFLQSLSLENNLQQARQEKDHRTEVLIIDYLDRYHEARSPLGMDFLEDLFNLPDDDYDPIDQLFGHLPDEVLNKLDKKAGALTQKISPEYLVQDIMKTTGNNHNILLAMMKNPEIFTAVLMLRAANDLGIDTGVSIQNIIECFNIDKKTSSFPF